MQLKEITNSLEERFNLRRDKVSHFRDHVTIDGESNDPAHPDKLTFTFEQFPDPDSYEAAAEKLARTPITEPNIRGYIRKDGKYSKYNVDTKEFTVYSIEHGEPVNITYFPCEPSYWRKCLDTLYPWAAKIDPDKDVK